MQRKTRHAIISTILALSAVLFSSLVLAQNGKATAPSAPDAATSKYELVAVSGGVISLTEPATYIVQLEAPAVASYKGGVQGLAATNPAATGTNRLRNTAATQAYVDYLQGVQTTFINSVDSALGRDVKVAFTYQHAFNGMAMVLTPLEADQVSKMDGVRLVVRETIEHLLTDVGPTWIGANGIWDGSGAPAGMSSKGEGVVVAILDTGINSLHPSFAAVGGDAYAHTNPLGAGMYLGVCDPSDPSYQPGFVCNDKLIGVHDFIGGTGNDPNSPEDGDGHGSHTASTVAGNVVTASLYAPTDTITSTISGVAPHANIIAYDVCRNGPSDQGGGCAGAALLAAVNQVVVDAAALPNGVAAINYSISGGTNPYLDPVELAFLAATDAGVYVSTSAGNSGPGAGTVAHVSPWVASTAASTHNRTIANDLTNMTSGGSPLPDIRGVAFAAGYGPANIVYAGDYEGTYPGAALCGTGPSQANPDGGSSPFPPGFFSGQIVICDRGTYGRVEKGVNVLFAGAGGMVLADNGAGLVADGHVLPAIHINQADGAALKAWVANPANTNPMATISGTIMDYSPANADVMGSFSSRGPVAGPFDLLKPDITAPGVDIWAAVNDDGSGPPDYDLLSGTSMASPHDAGAAALMAAIYPTWSPHQIKSALMLSADTVDNLKEDGTTPADPFDLGAGRIAVSAAANVGFVLDETTANFEAADPALNDGSSSALRALNLASMSNNNCVGVCSWTRTIKSVLPGAATYTTTVSAPTGVTVTVAPATFTLAAGASQTLTITADVTGAALGAWQFASVAFETTATQPSFNAGNGTNATNAVVLSEAFEGTFPPTGWSVIVDVGEGWNTNVYWGRANITPGTGQAAGADSDSLGDAVDTTLVTPLFDLTGYTSANLTFDSNFQEFAGEGEAWTDISTDGGTTWTNFHNRAVDEPAAGTSYSYDLSAYVGGTAQLRFRFEAPDWDWFWYIDNVKVTGASSSVPVTDMHMPIALMASAGNLPDLLQVKTYRDVGSETYDDLQAIEITASQVTMYGPTHATLHDILRAQDSNNGDPYDNLADVFYTTFTVAANSKRMVAEITAADASDVDMYWGSGTVPSLATQLGYSATGTALEYLSADNPPAGSYWVLVQNWAASSPGATDAITLATAVVPDTGSGLATFTMPAAVPGGTPFSATLNWALPGSVAGDRYYGAMDLGTDAGHPDLLGRTNVNIARLDDDVRKEASTLYAVPGDVVTYTITVAANTSDIPLTYTVTDAIPAGLTYVPGSATGGATVAGNVLSWTGTQNPPGRDYVVSTSLTDGSCKMPLANSGNYTNLEAFGFLANPGITANGAWQDTSYGGGPYAFYGDNSGTNTGKNLYFNGDGFVTLDVPSVLGGPYAGNSNLPNASLPNALLAMIWNSDVRIVYQNGTGPTNRGVTTGIQLTTGGVPSRKLLEFDGVQLVGDPASRADFEMAIAEAINDAPGEYEIIFAYDNLTGTFATGLSLGTIGAENYAGDRGTVYAHNDANLVLQNGMAICFDWAVPPGVGDHVITYQATVDAGVAAGTELTNVVESSNTAPGSDVQTAEATVTVPYGSGPALALTKSVTSTGPYGAGDTITYDFTVTNTGDVPLTNVAVNDPLLGGAIACAPTTLAPIAVATCGPVNYTVTSGDADNGSVDNTATATGDVSGGDVVSDEASVSTAIESVDLAIVKTGPASGELGQQMVFTIVVTNNSAVVANNVTVIDPTPAGLTFLSNSGACTTPFPCALGSMAAGETRTITATMMVPATYTGPPEIINTATVGSSSTDNEHSSTATVLLPTASPLRLIPANAPWALALLGLFTLLLAAGASRRRF